VDDDGQTDILITVLCTPSVWGVGGGVDTMHVYNRCAIKTDLVFSNEMHLNF